MKIINNNQYKIMFNTKFIGVGEVVEISDEKIIKMLLAQPNVVEYVDKEDVAKLEDENEKLKAQVALAEAKAKALELGIKFSPNIGLAKLQAKIEEKLKEEMDT